MTSCPVWQRQFTVTPWFSKTPAMLSVFLSEEKAAIILQLIFHFPPKLLLIGLYTKTRKITTLCVAGPCNSAPPHLLFPSDVLFLSY
jgi:hypothetical protein